MIAAVPLVIHAVVAGCLLGGAAASRPGTVPAAPRAAVDTTDASVRPITLGPRSRPLAHRMIGRRMIAHRPPRDDWFAEDKLKHFFMSLAATNLAYGAIRTTGLKGAPGLAAAGAVAAGLGLWKEWRDERDGGPFSVKDLAWDAFGIATGLFIAASTR